jgi:hypothetical protein
VVVPIARDLAIEALDVVVRYGSVVIGLACAELPVVSVEVEVEGSPGSWGWPTLHSTAGNHD